jgi:hypothetical protein
MPLHSRAVGACVVVPSLLIAAIGAASACDLCTSPTAPDGDPGLSLALIEQYTDFGTLREDDERVVDEVGQYLRSSNTQLVCAYRFSALAAAQVVVPYIRRAFRRPEGFAIDEGTEQGLGDIAVLGSLRVLQFGDGDAYLRIDDIGGIELPTGRSGRLAEEADEVVVPGAPESGVHGHDLALGSGSWDFFIGEEVGARLGRGYLLVRAQYAIRTPGDHHYQYANDLTWSVDPGVDVWRADGSRLGVEASLSGEAKGKDVANGEVAADTGVVSVYLGPQVACSLRSGLMAMAGADFPLLQHVTALQLAPDYKLRAALGWRF